jgi:hypothetical protein
VRAAELLRRLDERVLPPVARAMNAFMVHVGDGPGRTWMLTGVGLVSATAVLVTAVWAAQRPPVGEVTAGDVVRVGVTEGDSVPGYVDRSRAELDALAGAPDAQPAQSPPYALVTLETYLAPDRLAGVLEGAGVAEVFSRVPLRDLPTQIVRIPTRSVPDDVIAGMLLFAERKDREARDYEERAGAADDPGVQDSYRRAARTANAEATAYRTHCSCVYAAVVRAAPSALAELARRPGVRAVDPAPEVRRLDRAVFQPPLPEQTDLVGPPAAATPRVEATTVPAATTTPDPPGPFPLPSAIPTAEPNRTPGSSPTVPAVPTTGSASPAAG